MVDISGCELKIGDKVAAQYQKLFRIGVVIGFTKKKVIVGFDFTSSLNGEPKEEDLEQAKLSPWKLAKVVNQKVGLRDYYNYIKV